MIKLFVALMILVLPAVSLAQGDGPDSRGYNNPADVFIFRADVCPGNSSGCGTTGGVATNIITAGNGGVRGFVSFRVPLTAPFPSLASGVYRFTAIVAGANGRAAISHGYQFRYCNVACVAE